MFEQLSQYSNYVWAAYGAALGLIAGIAMISVKKYFKLKHLLTRA